MAEVHTIVINDPLLLRFVGAAPFDLHNLIYIFFKSSQYMHASFLIIKHIFHAAL